MENLLFDEWPALARTAVLGVLGYAVMVVLLRASGKRTLSKMNMFDLVITIAFGSVLSTLMLSKTTSLAQGTVAIAALVFLQFAVTFLTVRSGRAAALFKADAVLLYHGGAFADRTMRRERISRAEIEQAVRSAGYGTLEQVAAVVMETNGDLSVIAGEKMGGAGLLPRTGTD